MEEERAWDLFMDSGKIEDYLEYKNICNEYEDGEIETYQNNWNSYKGDRL